MSSVDKDRAVPVTSEGPDDVEMEIIRIAESVAEQASIAAEKWGDGAWTKALIYPLGLLGLRLKCQVCATYCRELEKCSGEWLYDLVWLKYSDDDVRLIGLPLILECEWNRHDGDIEICTAYARTHWANPKTGKMLGADQK